MDGSGSFPSWSQALVAEAVASSGLPDGTVTFLLTEAVGAARLREADGADAELAVERHQSLIVAVVESHGGVVAGRQRIAGDGVLAVFGSAGGALVAALDVHRAIGAEDGALPARIGIHSGEAWPGGSQYYGGAAVGRCARLRDVGHAGQVLLSAVSAALVAESVPAGGRLVDLGSHRLRDLARPERIFALGHPDLSTDPRPPATLDVLPNNLPTQLTSFVGRDRELSEIETLLRSAALVTLTGAGGCGKTRLALQVAAGLADRAPDGVWWVDLNAVAEPTGVTESLASVLHLERRPGRAVHAVVARLRGRTSLVCLDNCEHLLEPCAELVATLLRSCPGVTVLVTSREPLGVAGERVWRVPSLNEDESVRLFAERARSVAPGFDPGRENEDVVLTMCRKLDGIPLALELAAPWVRVLTPQQIVRGLDDRFRLLSGGPRGVLARHQTLAASMTWSHDLLDDRERAAFRRLAVFAPGFTLDAAVAVCAKDPLPPDDVLGMLGRLVDTSLVAVDGNGDAARYRMLESVREFAAARLEAAGEVGAARGRHLDHYLAVAEAAEPEMELDQDRCRAGLEADLDNIRAALRWGLSPADPHRGRRLAASMARLWFVHGHTAEGLEWTTAAIGLDPDDRGNIAARLRGGEALLAFGAGNPDRTARAAREALELGTASGDDRTRARALALAAFLPYFTDFAACADLCRQAREAALPARDPFALDLATIIEASSLTNRDRHAESVALVEPLLAPTAARGERFCAGFARACLAWANLFTGHLTRAGELAAESLEVARPLGDSFTVGIIASNAAWVHGLTGDVAAGQRLLEPIVRAVEDSGTDRDLLPWLAVVAGKLCLWDGDLELAHRRLSLATRFAEPMSDNWIVARALPDLATTLRQLGRPDEATEHACRAVDLARRLEIPHIEAAGLEELALLDDDPGRAEDLHHKALAVRVGHGLHTFVPDSLDGLARTAAARDGHVEATRLLGAGDRAREDMRHPRPTVDRDRHVAFGDMLRRSLGDDAFTRAHTEGTRMTLTDAVAYATRSRGPRGRPSSGWASLTPTELTVAERAATGLTNAEIGAGLFMSRSTVKTHLAHVYAKLGVGNRTELVAQLARRDR